MSTPTATSSALETPLTTLIERERQRRRRSIRVALLATAALALGSIAAWTWLRPRPLPLEARYRWATVTRGDVLRDVTATGHLDALTSVQVGAEISGRIATVEADFNDSVHAGQVLARFDRTTLRAQLDQALAQRAAALAAVAQARAEWRRGAREAARAEQLAKSQSITAQALDDARAAAEVAYERLQAASAELASRDGALLSARTILEHATIVSPIDGMVITRNVDPGQTVASMLQTPVLFTVAADLREMKVLAAVDEADIGEVKAGQSASFTVHAYSDRSFPARVTQVRNAPQTVQDVVTYVVELNVDNADLALKPGMTASVRIRTAEARSTPRVPIGALSFTPPDRAQQVGAGVWVLEHDQLRPVTIHPGVSDGELVAVADGELPLGARVVVELTAEGRRAHGLAP